jgi:hypothetical protein
VFQVGASDETLLSPLRYVFMPLDIYKGQWSKISKIKQSSKLILQIERNLVHLHVMPSYVQVISIPIPDTVVTPAVDVGTSNVWTNPAVHLVDAATPTVIPKDNALYQYNKYKRVTHRENLENVSHANPRLNSMRIVRIHGRQ